MDFTSPDVEKFALEHNLEAIHFEQHERGRTGKIRKQDVLNKIKQLEKIKNALKEYPGIIPEEDSIKKIIDLCANIYRHGNFPFGASERQYQCALKIEINDKTNWDIQTEVAVTYHYELEPNDDGKRKVRPLDWGLGGREDILISDLKLIIELKQLVHIRDKEFFQLLRYMEERRKYSNWGEETKGLLINFGDNALVIWLVQYKEGKLETIKMCEIEKTPFKDLVKSYKR